MSKLMQLYLDELTNDAEQLGILKTELEQNWSKEVRSVLERDLQYYQRSVPSIRRMIETISS